MPNQRSADQVAVTVYIPRDLKAALTAKAQERGETVSDAFRRWARRYVR